MSISVKYFVLNGSNLITTEPIGSDCFYVPGIFFIQYIRQKNKIYYSNEKQQHFTAELRN